MAEYVVLRNMTAARTAAPFDATRPRLEALAPPEPRVEVHDLDAKGVREVAREPEVAVVARRMPTTLIRPLKAAGGEAAAEGDAWGVAAVGADASSRTGDCGRPVTPCALTRPYTESRG